MIEPSRMDVVGAFLTALKDAGLAPKKDPDLIADGRIHRYAIDGDRGNKQNGWYVLHADGGIPAGAFGSWRTGEQHTWCAKADNELTPQERQQFKARQQAAREARIKAEEELHREIAAKAERLWTRARPAALSGESTPPYLIKKGIKPYGVRQMRQSLLVPVRDIHGRLWSLQFIDPDGKKTFLTGGKIQGHYTSIGKPDGALLICEGFATGASLRECTGYAVAIAFNAGNLEAVAEALRAKFPAAKIIICGDNDQWTEGNPGASKAEAAAERIGALVVIPEFSDLSSKPTDFNDLHRLQGAEAVRAAIETAGRNVVGFGVGKVRVEFKKRIDDCDDFETLTGQLAAEINAAGLPKPTREYLIARIAKKTDTSKASLMKVQSKAPASSEPFRTSDFEEHLSEMNGRHAIVPVGGKVLVLNHDYDPSLGRPMYSYSSSADLALRYANRFVWVAGESMPLADWWLRHPRRRQHEGVVFAPGGEVAGYLNLYTGFGVKPAPGDCEPFLDFVADVICGGNAEATNYVLMWLAHLFQKPMELPGTCLVLRGKQGTGKNTFAEAIAELVGLNHYLAVSSMSQVVGRFSGHLADVLLLFCNEAIWGGDKQAEGTLKQLITDPVTAVERKGVDIVSVRNYKRLLVASNEDWVVPMGADDRRMVVLEVSDKHKEDRAYFKAIKDQLKAGGYAALLDYFLTRDLSSWAPTPIPPALRQAGWDMKMKSGGSVVKWWFETLCDGYHTIEHIAGEEIPRWYTELGKREAHGLYLKFCERHRELHPKIRSDFGKELMAWGVSDGRPRSGAPSNRPRAYQFPPLDEARKAFAKAFNLPDSAFEE